MSEPVTYKNNTELSKLKTSNVSVWENEEKIKSIKAIYANTLTDQEFLLFCEIGAATKLNPFKKQIYAVKRNGQITIQTGIDGYRSIAARSGVHMGTSSAIYEMKDEKFPISATIIIKKLVMGHIAEFSATAYWNEYAQFFRDKTGKMALGNMWAQYPKLMLSKCAEALALRKAFPEEMAGTYIEEEINPNFVPNNKVIDSQKNEVISQEVSQERIDFITSQATEYAEIGDIQGLTETFNSLSSNEKKIIKSKFSELKITCQNVINKNKEEKNNETYDINQFDADLV